LIQLLVKEDQRFLECKNLQGKFHPSFFGGFEEMNGEIFYLCKKNTAAITSKTDYDSMAPLTITSKTNYDAMAPLLTPFMMKIQLQLQSYHHLFYKVCYN